MKLTTLIILIAFMQVSAKTYSQVTLHVNNKPLTEVLETVKKQTGYVFFYEGHLLDNINVSVDVSNATLKEALDKCLGDLPFGYNVVKKNVVIVKKDPSVLDKIKTVSVTPETIIGRITDTTGTPLIGATIFNKNSGKSVISDEKGEFSISVNEGDVLSITFIGYKPNVITVGKPDGYFNIPMHPSISGLKQVIVSTGYQTLSKDKAVGSYATIDNQLYNTRVSSNIIDRLEGNVPGLIFNRNTSLVSDNKLDINIDGRTTLFSNDQPLIVVDNFPFDGNISDLNPNDVENVTILKDAAAAAIWGVRSGNGVIVITTKKGKRNQDLKVELNANVTIGDKPNLYYNSGFLDSKDFIDVESKLFNLGYYNTQINNGPTYGFFVSPAVQILADQKSGKISASAASAQLTALGNNDVRGDLTKYFYQKSINQQYNINLNGGTRNSDYYFSVGEDHNLANQVGNIGNRITLKSKFNFYPTKNLQIGAIINYINTDAKSNSTIPSTIFPYSRLADANGSAVTLPSDYSQGYKLSKVNQGFLNWDYRPLDELKLADNTSQGVDNVINLSANYKIMSGLRFGMNYQYQKSTNTNDNNHNLSSYFTRNLINRYTSVSSDGSLKFPIPLGGILNQSSSDLTSQQFRSNLDYNHLFSQKHDVTALAGVEVRHQSTESQNSIYYGYDKDTFNNISTVDYSAFFPLNPYGSSQVPNPSRLSKGTYNFLSYYGNATYIYNSLYSIFLSARVEHSNLFGVTTNQKAVPVYAAALSWNLSREKFYQIDWMTTLKPKISYGYTANINLNSAAVTTISQSSGGNFFPVNYADIATPGNPDLRWEKNREVNFGIDFALKNSVLTGSIEYYRKTGIDLFGNVALAPSAFSRPYVANVAGTSSSGADIYLTSINIKSNTFRWMTNFSISYTSTKVTKYDVNTTPSIYFAQGRGLAVTPIVGAPIFSIYSYKWADLSHSTGDPQGIVNGKPSIDYNAILNNGSFDSLQYNGPARPTTFGFLRNTFSYKALSISFNIIYKFNYYFRRSSISNAGLVGPLGLSGLGNSDYTKAWQKAGDESLTSVPSIQYPPFNNNRDAFYQNSSVLVDKGDHIRLQDINLSYDLDKSNISWLPFSHIQLYGYVNNIGILWRANKDHLDPDLYSGGSIFNYPNTRTYSLGLKTNF